MEEKRHLIFPKKEEVPQNNTKQRVNTKVILSQETNKSADLDDFVKMNTSLESLQGAKYFATQRPSPASSNSTFEESIKVKEN